jgi:FkbM family methyltransferase
MDVRYQSLALFTPAERILVGMSLFVRRLLRRQLDAFDAAQYLLVTGTPTRSEGRFLVVSVDDPEVGAYSVKLRRFSSDFQVWQQCLAQKQYAPAAERLEADRRDAPPVIVDAGANVGFASLYFARRFPAATILAIEPDPDNLTVLADTLRRNGLRHVTPVRAALWGRDQQLSIHRAKTEWAHSVRSGAGRGAVPGLTVGSLLDQHGLDRVDLLKIDIEGAESDVFADADAVAMWIPRVRHLAIELHGPAAERLVTGTLARFGFAGTRCGELTLFHRQP